jgi:sugar phosphate permease
MRASLGISETDYSLAYGAATVVSGIALPFTGRLIDRYGARRLLPLIAASLCVACLVMGSTTRLAELYVGFTLVRCLVPLLNNFLITNYGWQTAWTVLGTIVAVTLVIPAYVLVRDRPEDMGLVPDGIAPLSAAANAPLNHTTDSWTLPEVLRDPSFWKLLSVPVTSGMVGTGMIFHQVSLLETRGVPTYQALALISLQATVATLAVLGAGWLSDRWPNQRLLAIAMILLATAVAIVLFMHRPLLAIGYAVLMGLHGSILRSAGMAIWPNYYGRQHQGVIRGVALSMMIFAAAVGPLPLALARDQLGTYSPALIFFIVVPLIAGCLSLSAKTPTKKVVA